MNQLFRDLLLLFDDPDSLPSINSKKDGDQIGTYKISGIGTGISISSPSLPSLLPSLPLIHINLFCFDMMIFDKRSH